jgi:hypothetical protein
LIHIFRDQKQKTNVDHMLFEVYPLKHFLNYPSVIKHVHLITIKFTYGFFIKFVSMLIICKILDYAVNLKFMKWTWALVTALCIKFLMSRTFVGVRCAPFNNIIAL